MSCKTAISFRNDAFVRLQAKIDDETLDIKTLYKNPLGLSQGILKEETEYPVFVMDLASVGLIGNVSGYGEGDTVYDCQIVYPTVRISKKEEIEDATESAKSIIYDIASQVIDVIFENSRGEISDGINFEYSIYGTVYVVVGYFQITK